MKLFIAFAAGFVTALVATGHSAQRVRTYYDQLGTDGPAAYGMLLH